MTRFIFITDTHLNGSPDGYKQQASYRQELPGIWQLLKEQAKSENCDFILNGGDVIDEFTEDTVNEARRLFPEEGLPTYMCLGNHDLTTADAAQQWVSLAPEFFIGQSLHYEIVTDDCMIHVIPNHWGALEYHWSDDQTPSFSVEQLQRLEANLDANKELKHIICTHANILTISKEQTGFDEEFHATNSDFKMMFSRLVSEFPQLSCIICGHNHINSINWLDRVPVISGASLTETPFEYKTFAINESELIVKTHSLFADTSFKCDYDFDKTFVQGRQSDRQLTLTL